MVPPHSCRELGRAVLIVNPTAGRRRLARVDAVVERLSRMGVVVETRMTERAGHARNLAADVGDAQLVVIAGGDGTVSEALSGLAAEGPPVAVFPLGTANVLAAELGLDADPERFAAAVMAGRSVEAWPGRANGEAFMLMASAGFDADAVAAVSARLKRRLGKGAYALAALKLWLAGWRGGVRVAVDGVPYAAASVVVAKGRYYGGRFVLAPEAATTVPRLFVVLMGGGRRRDLLRYAWAVLRGRLHRLPDVRVIPASEVVIETAAPAPLQLDGDSRGTTPAAIRLAARPVRLLVGEGYSAATRSPAR